MKKEFILLAILVLALLVINLIIYRVNTLKVIKTDYINANPNLYNNLNAKVKNSEFKDCDNKNCATATMKVSVNLIGFGEK